MGLYILEQFHYGIGNLPTWDESKWAIFKAVCCALYNNESEKPGSHLAQQYAYGFAKAFHDYVLPQYGKSLGEESTPAHLGNVASPHFLTWLQAWFKQEAYGHGPSRSYREGFESWARREGDSWKKEHAEDDEWFIDWRNALLGSDLYKAEVVKFNKAEKKKAEAAEAARIAYEAEVAEEEERLRRADAERVLHPSEL